MNAVSLKSVGAVVAGLVSNVVLTVSTDLVWPAAAVRHGIQRCRSAVAGPGLPGGVRRGGRLPHRTTGVSQPAPPCGVADGDRSAHRAAQRRGWPGHVSGLVPAGHRGAVGTGHLAGWGGGHGACGVASAAGRQQLAMSWGVSFTESAPQAGHRQHRHPLRLAGRRWLHGPGARAPARFLQRAPGPAGNR